MRGDTTPPAPSHQARAGVNYTLKLDMKPKTAAFTELQEQAMVGEKWRHKKRGTTYEIMADTAALQCATAPAFEQMFEESAWIVYRSIDTGAVYLRPALEFLDGRFEKVV